MKQVKNNFLTSEPQYIVCITSIKPRSGTIAKFMQCYWTVLKFSAEDLVWQQLVGVQGCYSLVFPCPTYTANGFPASDMPLVGFLSSSFRCSHLNLLPPDLFISSEEKYMQFQRTTFQTSTLVRNHLFLLTSEGVQMTSSGTDFENTGFWQSSSHSVFLYELSIIEPSATSII